MLLVAALASAQGRGAADGSAPAGMVVLGADGRGAEGAEVMILRQDQRDVSPTAAVLVDTATTASGALRSPAPRLAGLMVVVDHPDHLPLVESYPGAPPPEIVRLRSGVAVGGEVVARETGEAVAGAEVCASWVDRQAPERFQRWRRCGVSDDAGRFRLAGLPPYGLQIAAAAPGFVELSRTLDDATGPLALALVPRDAAAADAGAAGSAGRVLVEVVGFDGEPVGSFTMRVQTASGGRSGGTAMTVEQSVVPGVASIPAQHLEGGIVAVTFEADNHLRSAMQGVQLLPGGEVDLGVVFLESGAAVRERLFDAVGAEPAAGCVVELLAPGAGEIGAMLFGDRPVAVSDEAGDYLLGGLAEGRYHLRRQCHGAPVADALVVLGDAEDLDLGETWQHAGRRLAIRVDGLDEGSVRVFDRFREVATPIAETVLALMSESAARVSGEPAGTAELLLAPGGYRFEVLDGSGAGRGAQELMVDPAGPGEVQSVPLAARNRTIRSILTMDGRPVQGGSVRFGRVLDPGRGSGTIMMTTQAGGAAPRSRMFRGGGPSLGANVGEDGAFEVEGAPADLLWMTWFGTDGSGLSQLWPEGALAQLDLGGARVSGVLLDGDGVPVEGGSVALVGDIGRAVATTSTLAGGRFELPPAPPGRYLILGRSDRDGSVALELDLAAEPPPVLMLRMPLADPGGLEVTLRRPSGNAVAGAWLHVVGEGGDAVGTGLTSGRGRYAKAGLAAGKVSLIWTDGTACVGGDTVTVEGGETARLDLTLPTGRLMELRCPHEECGGQSLSFLSVSTQAGVEIAGHLSGATGGPRFAANGSLGIGCVTPGGYEISWWTGGRRWSADFEVSPSGLGVAPVVVRGSPAGL